MLLHDIELRRKEADVFDGEFAPEQVDRIEVDVEALQAQQRFALGIGEAHPFQTEIEDQRVERDALDLQRTAGQVVYHAGQLKSDEIGQDENGHREIGPHEYPQRSPDPFLHHPLLCAFSNIIPQRL